MQGRSPPAPGLVAGVLARDPLTESFAGRQLPDQIGTVDLWDRWLRALDLNLRDVANGQWIIILPDPLLSHPALPSRMRMWRASLTMFPPTALAGRLLPICSGAYTYAMIRRRAAAAGGIMTKVGNHSVRATGIIVKSPSKPTPFLLGLPGGIGERQNAAQHRRERPCQARHRGIPRHQLANAKGDFRR